METIFDHGVTDAETTVLFGEVTPREEYESDRRSADTAFGEIYRLFTIRGEPKAAEKALAKIKDLRYRAEVEMADLV